MLVKKTLYLNLGELGGKMRTKFFGIALAGVFAFIIGCATGNQPLNWTKADAIDFSKQIKVEINTTVPVPEAEVAFIKGDIETKLKTLFTAAEGRKDYYQVKITITRYEEGNAFARFILIGLGQMYLDGTVDVMQGDSAVVVRNGNFNKNFCVGGVAGGMATMHNDMNSKVAESIADAFKTSQTGPR
jgi:hypothetical protein